MNLIKPSIALMASMAVIAITTLSMGCQSSKKSNITDKPNTPLQIPGFESLTQAGQIRNIYFFSGRLYFSAAQRPDHRNFEIYSYSLLQNQEQRITFRFGDSDFPKVNSKGEIFFISNAESLKTSPPSVYPAENAGQKFILEKISPQGREISTVSNRPVQSLFFAQKNQQLLAVDQNKLFEFKSGEWKRVWEPKEDFNLSSIVINANGFHFLRNDSNGEVLLTNTRNFKDFNSRPHPQKHRWIKLQDSELGVLSLGQFGNGSQVISIWSESKQCWMDISHQIKEQILEVELSPEGRYLFLVLKKNDKMVLGMQEIGAFTNDCAN